MIDQLGSFAADLSRPAILDTGLDDEHLPGRFQRRNEDQLIGPIRGAFHLILRIPKTNTETGIAAIVRTQTGNHRLGVMLCG